MVDSRGESLSGATDPWRGGRRGARGRDIGAHRVGGRKRGCVWRGWGSVWLGGRCVRELARHADGFGWEVMVRGVRWVGWWVCAGGDGFLTLLRVGS